MLNMREKLAMSLMIDLLRAYRKEIDDPESIAVMDKTIEIANDWMRDGGIKDFTDEEIEDIKEILN